MVGATLNGDVKQGFVKSWYVQSGSNQVLGNHNRDVDYIKDEIKYWDLCK